MTRWRGHEQSLECKHAPKKGHILVLQLHVVFLRIPFFVRGQNQNFVELRLLKLKLRTSFAKQHVIILGY